jgi:hypothetical protein
MQVDTDLWKLALLQAEYAKIPACNRKNDFANNAESGQYIMYAVLQNHALTLQWLFDVGVDWHESAEGHADLVGLAVEDGHIQVIETLFKSSYPCSSKLRDLFERAVFNGQTEMMDWLVANDIVAWKKEEKALIFVAIMQSQFKALEWLALHGATLDEDATACAVYYNVPKMLEWLVARGVSQDREDPRNSRGSNVKFWLAEYNARGHPHIEESAAVPDEIPEMVSDSDDDDGRVE